MLALCRSSRSAAVRHGFGCPAACLRRALRVWLRNWGAARPTKLAACKDTSQHAWCGRFAALFSETHGLIASPSYFRRYSHRCAPRAPGWRPPLDYALHGRRQRWPTRGRRVAGGRRVLPEELARRPALLAPRRRVGALLLRICWGRQTRCGVSPLDGLRLRGRHTRGQALDAWPRDGSRQKSRQRDDRQVRLDDRLGAGPRERLRFRLRRREVPGL